VQQGYLAKNVAQISNDPLSFRQNIMPHHLVAQGNENEDTTANENFAREFEEELGDTF
jgi:hypothetical protein